MDTFNLAAADKILREEPVLKQSLNTPKPAPTFEVFSCSPGILHRATKSP
jgi:hypothetical protein